MRTRKTHVAAAVRKAGLDGLIDAARLAESLPAASGPPPGIRELLQWLDDQKAVTHLHVKREPLSDLSEWRYDERGRFVHREGKYFRVIGLEIESGSREIKSWSQPILENPRHGIIGLLVRHVRGRRQFLMQAKAEPGNRPPVQIAPTLQVTPSNYQDNEKLKKPFLIDEFVTPATGSVLFDTFQSEEGARFYHESHLHRIIEWPADAPLDLPPSYRWFSAESLRFFLHLGEHVNSCARSILACLP